MLRIVSVISTRLKVYFKYIVLNSLAGSYFCPKFVRRIIYALFGHHVTTVKADCFVGYGPRGHLTVGKGSYCNFRCFFDLSHDIIIGNNCSIGFSVTFVNSTHSIGTSEKRGGEGLAFPIVIEDGCWIGANAIIMPGVIVAKGCVIGAGSVVTKSTAPNGLYVGCPAKRIKDLP